MQYQKNNHDNRKLNNEVFSTSGETVVRSLLTCFLSQIADTEKVRASFITFKPDPITRVNSTETFRRLVY